MADAMCGPLCYLLSSCEAVDMQYLVHLCFTTYSGLVLSAIAAQLVNYDTRQNIDSPT